MDRPESESAHKDLSAFYALCEETFFPPIDLTKYQIPSDVLVYIPERIAIAYQVIPISAMGNILTVAMSDPLNVSAIDSLRLVTQMEIAPVIAPLEQIVTAIEMSYALGGGDLGESEAEGEAAPLISAISSFREKTIDVEAVTKLSKQAKVINMVNKMLGDAVKSRASDIHIEPGEDDVRVRCRIDGVLHEMKTVKKHLQEAVIARIKILSRLDITQHRIPQDGRFGFRTREKEIDVRVSMLPIDFGEKVVLRLLDKASVDLDVKSLGFSTYALEAFEEAIAKPLGMILLTGPTGSGKTTTLYSLLNALNTAERSLVTIEDPVEYNLSGITQVPVRHEIGLGFAPILRATLRQSPDIIMVGEIRDFETVDIAMKAALTGHIVFSTLHTNDAPSAATRLLNMDVEPFLISFSLNMIAAQRLVRTICSKCKQSHTVDLTKTEDIPSQYRQKGICLYKGKGCSACANTGYIGRVAVVEAFLLNTEIREMIIRRASADDIREYAKAHCGMKTLREDAMDKCLKGETTLEEVLRVTMEF
ncbi:MAG: type II/IV secretion system protein [Candidatus Omnitrophota bacterium]|nr:MAG: type II/IV secretion system protein [Candidatus Omnitrophota bacterium]